MPVRALFLFSIALALAAGDARAQAAADSVQVAPPDFDPAGIGAHRDTFLVADNPPYTFRLRRGIIPGSLQLRYAGEIMHAGQYRVDPRSGEGELFLTFTPEPGTVLVASYRTLPFEFDGVFARRRIVSADSIRDDEGRIGQPIVMRPTTGTAEEPLFAAGSGLQRRGSITRGVIAGSNRDVSLESGLRLELSGEVAAGVNVQAVLTDENTPIQPEGTTQRLSEFDRVYVEINTAGGQARLGDVDVTFQGGEFTRLQRRLQGGALRAALPRAGFGIAPISGGHVTAVGATTRGLFQSQDIVPVEGVQGPYRLRGRQGEEFVVVIAGSERVFLDGRTLTRGESNDYVIDYATGEIRFTPRVLVTAERRITVDFEYTTSQFTRALLGAEAEVRFGSADRPSGVLHATVLREADAASFGAELGLTESDLDLIAAAGRDPAVIPGAQPAIFDAESPFVLYTRRDTTLVDPATGQPVTIPIYVPARRADAEVFRLRFSRVAPGTQNLQFGTYRRAGQVVNGIVYEFAGLSGGEYVPLRLLPAPEARNVVGIRGSTTPMDGLELFGEWATSAVDANTLSSLAGTSEAGNAYTGGARLSAFELPGLPGQFSGELRHRTRGATFEAFERLRPVDFTRTWNIARGGGGFGTALDTLRESTTEVALRWSATPRSFLATEVGAISVGDQPVGTLFSGRRLGAEVQLEEAQWLGGLLPIVSYRMDFTTSSGGLGPTLAPEEGGFLRQRSWIRRPVLDGRLTPGVRFEQERREQRLVAPDSLLATSFSFTAIQPGISWNVTNLQAGAGVEFRREAAPLNGFLVSSAETVTIESDVSYRASADFQSEASVAYRRRTALEPFRGLPPPSAGNPLINPGIGIGAQPFFGDNESVAVRWTTRATPFDRFAEVTSLYEATTERTPRLQEAYIYVGPELGEYVWIDFNGDGIPQIDEFVPETTPLEGTYARVLIPGDELVPAAGVQAQLRLRMDPSRLLPQEAGGASRFLREIVSLTTIEIQERTTEPDLLGVFLLRPGRLQQRDSVLVDPATGERGPPPTLNGRMRFAQELTFFRSQPRYGLRLFGSRLISSAQLAAGIEVRRLETIRLEGRAAPTPWVGLRLSGIAERNAASSTTFASRTFDVGSLGLEPEATLTLSDGLTVITRAALSRKTNAVAAGSTQPTGATVVRLPVEARYSRAGRFSFALRGELANVSLDGGEAQGGLVSFELTDGRGPGRSMMWGLSGQYTLSEFLRASLTYDGRAPQDAPLVHTMRLSISAAF
ncbi:hypothetical protein BH23BAC4_BH23BAC4_06510 [soil metagenome]